MISIGNALATGAKALAFAALNKFDTLNSIVNRLSGGKVNRDTLAQSVLRGACEGTPCFAVSAEWSPRV